MKLTPWFPGHIKPVREGVYEINSNYSLVDEFSYWEGKYWGAESLYKNRAKQLALNGFKSCNQFKQWRGVAK